MQEQERWKAAGITTSPATTTSKSKVLGVSAKSVRKSVEAHPQSKERKGCRGNFYYNYYRLRQLTIVEHFYGTVPVVNNSLISYEALNYHCY